MEQGSRLTAEDKLGDACVLARGGLWQLGVAGPMAHNLLGHNGAAEALCHHVLRWVPLLQACHLRTAVPLQYKPVRPHRRICCSVLPSTDSTLSSTASCMHARAKLVLQGWSGLQADRAHPLGVVKVADTTKGNRSLPGPSAGRRRRQ